MPYDTPPQICPNCECPIKKVPAGTSKKTGKPYNEFWVCENPNCKFTWNKPKQSQEGKIVFSPSQAEFQVEVIHLLTSIAALLESIESKIISKDI